MINVTSVREDEVEEKMKELWDSKMQEQVSVHHHKVPALKYFFPASRLLICLQFNRAPVN